jgi:IS5 family transposase
MKAFGHAPQLYGADRGFFSEPNMASCARSGVSTVSIPQRGGKKAPDQRFVPVSRGASPC